MALLPGTPCIVMASGGIPVAEAPAGFGTALTPASNGLGIGVTIVTPSATLGGWPVTFIGEDGTLWPGGVGGVATGNGTMDFSIATGDDTGLLALLEDI